MTALPPALAGQPLIPLGRDAAGAAKVPLVRGWPRIGAAALAAHPAWRWAAGVGMRLDGLVVVDVDDLAREAAILTALGLADTPTLTQETPRPGRHHVWRGRRRTAVLADGGGSIKSGAGHQVAIADWAAPGLRSWGGAALACVPPGYRHPGGAVDVGGPGPGRRPAAGGLTVGGAAVADALRDLRAAL